MEDWQSKLEEFIETASHDLHAPLRKLSVLMDRFTEKIKTSLDDEAKGYISRMNNNIHEMRVLIDNLSELARANNPVINYTECDLGSLVKQVQQDLQEEITEKKAVISVDKLPVVKADPVQYRQLFRNILENAIKFSKKDIAPQISIQLQEVTDDKIKIVISDNGIGFKTEYAERIFEPFVRLHAKSQYPGSGLGLAICKKIIANHHGIIYAEGRENEGSRFTLILPSNP